MSATTAATEADEFVVLNDGRRAEDSPTLVVEIETPDTRFTPMMRRIASHFREGAGIVWLVHPEAKAVTVFWPNRNLEVLKPADELTGGDVLPGFTCTVADSAELSLCTTVSSSVYNPLNPVVSHVPKLAPAVNAVC